MNRIGETGQLTDKYGGILNLIALIIVIVLGILVFLMKIGVVTW